MKSIFTDHLKRDWTLRLTVASVSAIRRETGVDVGVRADSQWVDILFADNERLAKVLWILCASQAEKRNVSPEDFAELLDGAALEDAGNALMVAYADFFPRRAVAAQMNKSIQQILTAADAKMVADLKGKTASFCGPATNSPESAELTPQT